MMCGDIWWIYKNYPVTQVYKDMYVVYKNLRYIFVCTKTFIVFVIVYMHMQLNV